VNGLDIAYCYRPSSVVCRSDCHSSDPCRKRLNRSRCRLGWGLLWTQNLDGVQIFPRKGQA